jgi:hypothetical protein
MAKPEAVMRQNRSIKRPEYREQLSPYGHRVSQPASNRIQTKNRTVEKKHHGQAHQSFPA